VRTLVGGVGDWFIPSFQEVQALFVQREVVGGISGLPAWSSGGLLLTYSQPVRPIRYF